MVSTVQVTDSVSARLYPSPSEQEPFFARLQREVGEWSQKNFGDQLPHRPLLGIIEELCEFGESMTDQQRVDVIDAIGDITIYMADYCHRRGWSMAEIWAKRWVVSPKNLPLPVLSLIRWCAHSHLKGEQNIRGGTEKHDRKLMTTLGHVLSGLETTSRFLEVDYLAVVIGTWSKVSKRDWVENPNDAHAVAGTIPDMKMKLEYEVGDEEHEF